jgi:hypothetical protein
VSASDAAAPAPGPVEQTAPPTPEPEPPPHPVRIPNDGELSLQDAAAGPFAWRFAYARASERRSTDKVGQDYLTFEQADDRFAFALCDGVGQSYFGDLAARLLGDALLGWLWAAPAGGATADDLGEALTAWLTDLTDAGTAAVAAHESASTLAPLVAQVLERKRAEGSATTVTGGRIELTDDGRIRLLLVALGDSRLRVWVEGTEITVHSVESQVGHGWSTRRGIVGGPPSLSLFNSRVKAVRILAYSDGLTALDAVPDQLSSAELRQLIEESQADPASDDIAVLDVWLRNVEAGADASESDPDASASDVADDAATLIMPRPGPRPSSGLLPLDEPPLDEPLEDDAPTPTVLPASWRTHAQASDSHAAPSDPLGLPDDASPTDTSAAMEDVRSADRDDVSPSAPAVTSDGDASRSAGGPAVRSALPAPVLPVRRGVPTGLVVLLVVVVVVAALLVVLAAVWLVILRAPALAPGGASG